MAAALYGSHTPVQAINSLAQDKSKRRKYNLRANLLEGKR